jgi:hypothetical protein
MIACHFRIGAMTRAARNMKILAKCEKYVRPPTTKNKVMTHSTPSTSKNTRLPDFEPFLEAFTSLWNLICTPPYLPYISIPYIRVSFNKGNVKEG